MKELPHMFSTYSHASLKTQVNNYFETCDSDGTGKFKSYTSDEAWETARIALGLPDWLKKSTKSDANCNHVILCMKDDANFATYLGYALVAKLNDPKAHVHLVTYHKTGRLTSPMELLDKRSKFRGLLKETQTKRTRALKRGVTLIDSHHALPQICG